MPKMNDLREQLLSESTGDDQNETIGFRSRMDVFETGWFIFEDRQIVDYCTQLMFYFESTFGVDLCITQPKQAECFEIFNF